MQLTCPRSIRRSGLLAIALALCFAPSAFAAATVSVSGTTLTINGSSGNDTMRVVYSPVDRGLDEYGVMDFPGIVAGAGCTQVAEDVYCGAAGLTNVNVNLGDGDDVVLAGSCLRSGQPANEVWNVQAGPGNDDVDMWTPEHGGTNDVYNGDSGTDFVNYSHRAQAMTIDLAAGTATTTGNPSGEGTDTLQGVENATAGLGADTVNGTAGPNRLRGGVFRGPSAVCSRDAAVDTINAGEGDDHLIGAKGNDNLNGDGGSDTVSYEERTGTSNGNPVAVNLATNSGGSPAFNEIDVLDSIENIVGSAGGDNLTGDGGPNHITSREPGTETQDSVTCGGGVDTVVADALDNVDAPSCETVDRPSSPDGDGDGVPDGSDACPNVAGTIANNGCPPDTDGDGVTDDVDQCDNTPAPGTANGCPLPTNNATDPTPPANSTPPANPAPPADPGPPAPTPTPPAPPSAPRGNLTAAAALQQVKSTGRGIATLSFAFGSAGQLTIDGTTRLPGRRVAKPRAVVAAVTRVVRIRRAVAAGPQDVVIRVTGAAKRALGKAKRLKVRLTITYTPAGGAPSSTTRTLTLKLAK
ncbi:MAG TPA: thrombospondin type 3 repeat-containing protein [Solirubrobacteraceae bacterium]|nr:thrombospondin type 3 repeat-containing protein [Solirubrobacteraceae bacterium]